MCFVPLAKEKKKIGHEEISGVEAIGNSGNFTLKVVTKDGKQVCDSILCF